MVKKYLEHIFWHFTFTKKVNTILNNVLVFFVIMTRLKKLICSFVELI